MGSYRRPCWPPTPPTDLLGAWRFDRVVEDRRSGERSEVHGTGLVTRVSATRLRWHEEGTWVRGGLRSPVQRTHHLEEVDGAWVVLFDDGRLFHPWVGGDDVVHPCGDDTYAGRYDLTDLPRRWRTEWHCTGPAKDYVLTTTWTRAASAPPGRRRARP